MKLNEAIIKIRVELQKRKLKMTGKNTHAGFSYFELSDFLPTLNELMLENQINDQITIGKEYAGLTLIKGDEKQTYTIPFVMFDVPTTKNGSPMMQQIQYLGAICTYYKRYLYMNAFGITDGDVIDNLNNSDLKPPIKNYSISEIETLAEVKNIPIENICKGYGVESLQALSQEQVNKAFLGLQKK